MYLVSLEASFGRKVKEMQIGADKRNRGYGRRLGDRAYGYEPRQAIIITITRLWESVTDTGYSPLYYVLVLGFVLAITPLSSLSTSRAYTSPFYCPDDHPLRRHIYSIPLYYCLIPKLVDLGFRNPCFGYDLKM